MFLYNEKDDTKGWGGRTVSNLTKVYHQMSLETSEGRMLTLQVTPHMPDKMFASYTILLS